ncbi:hypothetical protein [Burkholderia sp. Ax-1719]|nr:hypothetical protein [Burkholderia sp. Ax-1719]NIE67644.1 hypothetical protein [Burkholderia sp. Ax-1719]
MILTGFRVNRYSGFSGRPTFGVAQCSLTYRSDAHGPVKKDARAQRQQPNKDRMAVADRIHDEPVARVLLRERGRAWKGLDRRSQPAPGATGFRLARAMDARGNRFDPQRDWPGAAAAAFAQHVERATNRSRTLCPAHAAISLHRVRRSRDLRTMVSMTAVFPALFCCCRAIGLFPFGTPIREVTMSIFAYRKHLRFLTPHQRRRWWDQKKRLTPRVQISGAYVPPSVSREFAYVKVG